MEDTYDLERFVSAQATMYPRVLAELQAGEKRSHWIWFIFPELKGLGFSEVSQFYGIGSLEEAAAYWRHPVLGPRLEECVRLVSRVEGKTIQQILGSPDDLKFRSSMTLFGLAVPEVAVFGEALKKCFGGEADARTLDLLR